MSIPVENTAVATRQAKPIDTVRAVFEKMKPQFAAALPKHITPDRMVRVALTAIQNTPKLLDCDKQSLYSAVMRAAQLGLEPDGVLGQAYLLPFGKQVQFIPGYKGLIDLARRSGEVSNIIAKEVCEHDEFDVDWSREIPFNHKPKLEGDRGTVTHFWALAKFKDGGFHWDYLSKAEVEAIRDRSQGKNNAVWKEHFVEMGKKTAIRRIAKFLPMSVQKAAMVEDLIDAGKKFTTDEYGDIVIEGDVTPGAEEEKVIGQAKPAKLDQFANHDPETGEVLEQVAEKNQQAAQSDEPATTRPAAVAIPMPTVPGDNTQSDINAWAEKWEEAVASAPDVQWLEEMRKVNEKALASFAKRNAAKHAECVQYYDEMMAALGDGKAAA